jgi:hypothetical protein
MARISTYERRTPVAGGATNHPDQTSRVSLIGALLHQISALLRDR